MAAKKKPASSHPVRTLSRDGERILKKLRAICESMPECMEKVSHGEPTWFAGPKGKVFAMFDNHHHGSPHISVWLPTPPDVQDALVASDPAQYFVPPYVGPKGWTGVVLDNNADWKEVENLVAQSYLGVARKVRSSSKA